MKRPASSIDVSGSSSISQPSSNASRAPGIADDSGQFVRIASVRMRNFTSRDLNPAMLAAFPNGKMRRPESGVSESAYRNGDKIGKIAAAIMNGRSAFRTEMISHSMTTICGPDPAFGIAFGADLVYRPTGLDREDTARTLLAGEAMTDRNAGRFSAADRFELTASARRNSVSIARYRHRADRSCLFVPASLSG
jgi:hypothetical protein